MPTLNEWLTGHTVNGVILDLGKVNVYRSRRGLPPLEQTNRDVQPGKSSSLGEAAVALPTHSTTLPSLFQRVRTFAGALVNYVKDGMTKCTDDEIQARLAVCQSCPSFTGTLCKECGCGCSARSTFFNKLAWRSEQCPLGKWPAGGGPPADEASVPEHPVSENMSEPTMSTPSPGGAPHAAKEIFSRDGKTSPPPGKRTVAGS